MYRQTLRWINRALWTAALLMLLPLALYVAVGRMVVDSLESNQQQIVEQLRKRSGLELSIGKISGEWSALMPIIRIEQFVLYNPENKNEPVVMIDSAQARLDIISSLLNSRIGIGILDVEKLHLKLLEDASGGWSVKGFSAGGGSFQINRLIDSLLAIESAQWDSALISLQSAAGKTVEILASSLKLEAEDDFHRIELAMSPEGQDGNVNVLLEIEGDPRDFTDFKARGLLQLNQLNLAPLLNLSERWGFPLLRSMDLDGRLWLEKNADDPLQLWGELASDELPLAALKIEQADEVLTDVVLRVGFEVGEKQLDLHVAELSAQLADQSLSMNQWRVTIDTEKQVINLGVVDLPLSGAASFLKNLPKIPRTFVDTVSALSPGGALQNIKLTLPLSAPQNLTMQADLKNVSVASWSGAPAAHGVNGYLSADATQGRIQLDSKNFSLGFPAIYSQPLKFENASAEVAWTIAEKNVRVTSGPIYVRTANIPVTGLLDLLIPLNDTEDVRPATMGLSLGLRSADAALRNIFIPDLIVDKGLKKWLDSSIKSGRAIAGNYLYHGSIEKNANTSDRTSQLWLDIENGGLQYQADLPAVTQAKAQLYVDDQNVTAKSSTAKMFDDVELSEVNVSVSKKGVVNHLSVSGSFSGKDDAVVEVLKSGLIQKAVNGAFDSWTWRGLASGKIQVELPLSGTKKPLPADVTVDVALQEGSIFAEGVITSTDQINGVLRYQSKSGINSSGITGRWHGSPLQLTIAQQKDVVVVKADGKMSAQQMQSWLNQPVLDFVSGEVTHKTRLDISPKGTALEIKSDLAGMAINLPVPYKKIAKQKWPFVLNATLDKKQQNYTMRFERKALLQLRFNEGLPGGLLTLGDPVPRSLEDNVFQVTGYVGSTDLGIWLDWFKAYQSASDKRFTAKKPASEKSSAVKVVSTQISAANTDVAVIEPDINKMDLQVRDLLAQEVGAWGQTLRQVRIISASQNPASWVIDVEADRLAGKIIYPKTRRPLQLQLERINFPAPVVIDHSAVKVIGEEVFPPFEEDVSALLDVDFSKLIDVDAQIKNIYRGERNIGQINAQLRVAGNQLSLNNMVAGVYGLRIGATREGEPALLRWTKSGFANTVKHESEFKAQLQFENLAETLESLGYEKAIESKSGSFNVDLTWPKPLDDPDLADLSGAISVDARNGRFPDTSGGTSGVNRVLGIFNFDNLLRRLRFDFTDIYKSGVAYDRMSGEMQFDDGMMRFVRPLKIVGPGIDFRISGDLDFAIDHADMELVATLPVASNLPWFAALAGGVPLAAGAYVFTKVFENSMNNFSSVVYAIEGNWADPQVNFKHIYDSVPERKAAPVKK